jgi:predicted HNH restriction endonuclease
MSQISYLKWFNNQIFLDIASDNPTDIESLKAIATPNFHKQQQDADAEIIALGTIDKAIVVPQREIRQLPTDIAFTEGKRLQVIHLRIERSSKLRKMFLAHISRPITCDMCQTNMDYRYPWTTNLIEIHHLLPLSSTIAFEKGETSLSDLVALCPNCHRSVHVFYVDWLKQQAQDDFLSIEEAKSAYFEAKQMIRL